MLELLEEEGFFLAPLWELRESIGSGPPTVHQAWLLVQPEGRAFLRAYSNRWANGIEFLKPCCAFSREHGVCKKCSAMGSFVRSRSASEQAKKLEDWLEAGTSPLVAHLFFTLVLETFEWAFGEDKPPYGSDQSNRIHQALLDGREPSLAAAGLPSVGAAWVVSSPRSTP